MPPIPRRSFVESVLGFPLLIRAWKAGPPTAYLEELSGLMRAAPVPGAVIGTLRDYKPGWVAPLGVQAADVGAPVTASTLFQAASLTKQVAAYAAFALRDQGKLDFDRPLVSYLDDLPSGESRVVTIRNVLSHSSGFPNWRYADASTPLPDLVPSFPPGTGYQYSGEGYFYLQRVMEQITGKGIGELIRDLVFQPLGMKSSTLVWEPGTLARTAQPHTSRGELRKGWEKRFIALEAFARDRGKTVGQLRYVEYAEAAGSRMPNTMRPNAAASLVTSAENYTRFLAAALRNPEIFKQQIAINEFLGWGLGWAIERAGGHSYVWQWGDNPGFKNFVIAEAGTGDALFVFTNGDAGMRVCDRVVTHATGHDHPALFWL